MTIENLGISNRTKQKKFQRPHHTIMNVPYLLLCKDNTKSRSSFQTNVHATHGASRKLTFAILCMANYGLYILTVMLMQSTNSLAFWEQWKLKCGHWSIQSTTLRLISSKVTMQISLSFKIHSNEALSIGGVLFIHLPICSVKEAENSFWF